LLGLPAGRRVVLFVGRIEPLKGIDTLLRAMAVLASNGASKQGRPVGDHRRRGARCRRGAGQE